VTISHDDTIYGSRAAQNANPENVNRYTSLCWAKVFTEQADRLLTEVLECVGLKLDMLTLYYLARDASPMSIARG